MQCITSHVVVKLIVVLQDPVPKVGKFWVLFTRPGQRVLVNQGGDMQVRPTPLDRRLTPLSPCQPLSAVPYMHVDVVLALPACLPVCMSIHLSDLLSVCLSVCLSALSVCLSVC